MAAVSSLLERVVATLCPVVSGLAVVTFVIFSVMAFVAEWILPHWRAQWTYFEDNLCADRWECRNYGSFMYLLHTPILLAAVIDVYSKRPASLLKHTPGLTAYIIILSRRKRDVSVIGCKEEVVIGLKLQLLCSKREPSTND